MSRESSRWPLIVGVLTFLIILAGGLLLFFAQGYGISGAVYVLAALLMGLVLLKGRGSEDELAAGSAPAPQPLVGSPAVADAAADDLTRIEGVGPKIADLLRADGIGTFAQLAGADVDRLRRVLADAGSRFQLADPSTWPHQARLAADGKWDELDKLQEELQGGRQAG